MLNLREKMLKAGYVLEEERDEKLLNVFYAAGIKEKKSISSMLLTGKAGCGKTSMTEAFASTIGAKYLFVQCYTGMTSDSFYVAPNIEGILRNDSMNAVKKGLLVRALEATTDGDVVVVIDELDKARPEVDAFLLDFIQNGRISTGQEIFRRGSGNIWLFITSNQDRELSSALTNRIRKLEVTMNKEQFLSILNLPEDHYLGMIFEKDPDFSIRQAKSYLTDLALIGKSIEDFDMDILQQYLSTEIEVDSLEDFQSLNQEDLVLKDFELVAFHTSNLNHLSKTGIENLSDIKFDNHNNNYTITPHTEEELQILYFIGKNIDAYDPFYPFNTGYLEISKMNSSNMRWFNKENDITFGCLIVSDDLLFGVIKYKNKLFLRINNMNDFYVLPQLNGFENLEFERPQENYEYEE